MTETPPSLQFTEGEKLETAAAERTRAKRAKEVQKIAPDKGRKAAKDRKRGRMAYDLPQDVIEAVRAIAKQENVSQSNLVGVVLAEWANAYTAGEIEIDQEKRQPSQHPRWVWKLDIPGIDGRV